MGFVLDSAKRERESKRLLSGDGINYVQVAVVHMIGKHTVLE